MLLALYKAAAIWKENSGLTNLRLVKVLIRDQALYFLAYVLFHRNLTINSDTSIYRLISVCALSIISGFILVNQVLYTILSLAGNPAFLSILGAHILFNMKEAGAKGLNQGTSCISKSTISNMDFAESHPTGANQFRDASAELDIVELEDVC